jgi:GTP cyclohydrolase FolE2
MACHSSQSFTFIVNREGLPNPFLVEISRRKKTLPKDVAFYAPSVYYCPLTMTVILQSILDNQEVFEQHRWVVKAAMVSVLEEADGDVLDDEWKLQKIAVEAIIVAVAEKQSTDEIACNLREKRLVDEAYLRPTFVEDVKRSLNELKYIVLSRNH